MILAFDTSNYTTSACLFDEQQGILWQNRIILHPPQNQRGFRQSDVVFLHTKNMEHLLDTLPQNACITAIAASARPRPVDGSYMPCFLVGHNFAKSMAQVMNVPFYAFSHQENHIMAGVYSSGHTELIRDRFVAFHISGGTSDILLVSPNEQGIQIDQIGGCEDLHAGQLIDRIGVRLGLQFPCGKEIEQMAQSATQKLVNRVSVDKFSFHLSGFENQAQKLMEQHQSDNEIAKFALDAVLKTIDKVIANLRKEYPAIPILMVGGVMSNRYIAAKITAKYDGVLFSDPQYSSDHALGNAVLCSMSLSK